MSLIQQFFKHPLWLVGFRSLFALGFISGMVLPINGAVSNTSVR